MGEEEERIRREKIWPDSNTFSSFFRTYTIARCWRYTHFSHPQSFTSLEYFLITPGMAPRIKETEIHEISITAHAIVAIKLQTTVQHRQQNIWRYPSRLANLKKFTEFLKKEREEYSQYNQEHKSNLTLFWEAGKVCMRGRIISYDAAHKREIQKKYSLARSHLRESQLKYQ